ncbi:MAG: hypothetical protein RJA70_4466 [Pseudomonadota bacterium]
MARSTMTRFLFASLTAGSLWQVPATAEAQGTGKAAAEALFIRAQQLLNEGKNEQACVQFSASQSLDPAVGTLLYLGDCYEVTERFASAWATFREANDLAARKGDEKRGRIASVRAQALEPTLHRVVLVVNGAPEGFELSQGGQLVPPSTFGLPLPVDAGELMIEARAPGHESWVTRIRIPKTPGETRVVVPPPAPTMAPVIAPPPAPKPAASLASPAAPPDPGWTQTHTAYSFGIAGLIGLGIGTGFGVDALSKNDDSSGECDGDNQCTPTGVELRGDALASARLATIGLIAGSALLGTGLVLLVTSNSDRESISLQLNPLHAQLTFKGDL